MLRLFAVGVFVADLDGDVGGGEPLRDGPAACAGGGVVVGDLLLAFEEEDLLCCTCRCPLWLRQGVEVAPADDRVECHGEQGRGLAGGGVAAQTEIHQAQGVPEGEVDDPAASAAQAGLRLRVEQVRLVDGGVHAGEEDAVRHTDAGFGAMGRCGNGEEAAVLGGPEDGRLRCPDAGGAPADLRPGEERLCGRSVFALGVVPDRDAEIDVRRVLAVQGSLGGRVHHGVEDQGHLESVPVRDPEGTGRHREAEEPCDQQSDMSYASMHHRLRWYPGGRSGPPG